MNGLDTSRNQGKDRLILSTQFENKYWFNKELFSKMKLNNIFNEYKNG